MKALTVGAGILKTALLNLNSGDEMIQEFRIIKNMFLIFYYLIATSYLKTFLCGLEDSNYQDQKKIRDFFK